MSTLKRFEEWADEQGSPLIKMCTNRKEAWQACASSIVEMIDRKIAECEIKAGQLKNSKQMIQMKNRVLTRIDELASLKSQIMGGIDDIKD